MRDALCRMALGVLLGGFPLVGWAQEPAEAPASRFTAVHTQERPRIDGRLDEAAWEAAPAFSAFHQSRPHPGAPPSERTEARILHDGSNLYVGVRCFDREPQAIHAQLGRRDRLPTSDTVWVMIDSMRDLRTGRAFAVNAGGTLEDARLLQDTEWDTSWDGVWEGAAARESWGWSVELRIPLEELRFPPGQEQRWGFHIRRYISRTNEQLDSVPLPPEVNALVSRFAELHALQGVEQPRYLTLLPYVAVRLGREPRPPGPRLMIPTADVGLDAQASLTPSLALTFTANPNYGQVEADDFIINRTRLETFLTEKRPFFQEGLDLFAPLVDDPINEQRLFYSRRIGLELPLLTAVKLSGSVHERVQVDVLDALVAGEFNPSPDAVPPDPGLRFRPLRPLHLTPNFALPDQVLPPTNFFAGVAQLQVGEGNVVRGTTTLSTPLLSRCTLGEPSPEEDCRPWGGRTAALATALRTPSGDYELAAQVAGSQVTGGPLEGELQGDATLLRDGDMGLGFQLSGGKRGGEPWQLGLGYSYASPQLELNPTGFQLVSNQQALSLTPEYVRSDWGGLLEARLGAQALAAWSTDGRALPLGTSWELFGSALLPNSTSLVCSTGVELGRRDLLEMFQTGVVFQRPSVVALDCSVSSDARQRVSLAGRVQANHLLEAPATSARTGSGLLLDVTWKPLPRLQTGARAAWQNDVDGPRWWEETGEGLHVFVEPESRFLIFTLRQLVVLTPTLTLQGFAQLLSGYDYYEHFYEAEALPGEVLHWKDLSPTVLEEDPSSRSAQFNVNLVLRWEYALGSTLFVVYTRAQGIQSEEGGRVLLPYGVLGGRPFDALLVKLGYRL